MTPDQPTLPLFSSAPEGADAEWFVAFLTGREWLTAAEILRELGMSATENNKRWLRKLADKSEGRIAGHQKGYKLVRSMTGDEYQWWRNEWLKANASTLDRIRKSDRVFYGRQEVAA